MKKNGNEWEVAIREALRGKKVPILVLDRRWHALFPRGEKPADILALENQLNELLKRQGHLVNDIKDLKKTKKKLMGGIVAGMGDAESESADKKKKNQQRLMLEMNERLEAESDELMGLPGKIKAKNEELLARGASYCFERLANGDSEIERLEQQIRELKKDLNDMTSEKAEIEESMDSAYSLMHGLLGHDVMNLYDTKKK